MAWEDKVLMFGNVRAATEASPGAATTLAATDVRHVEEFSIGYKTEKRQRPGVSSHPNGNRSSRGQTLAPWGLMSEMQHITIANEATDDPRCAVWLRATAFERSHTSNTEYTGPGVASGGSATDKIVTYTAKGYTPPNATCKIVHTINAQTTNQGIDYEVTSALAGWEFEIPSNGDDLIFRCVDGQGNGALPAANTSPDKDAKIDTVIINSKGMHHAITVMNSGGDVLIGGGTETAPDMKVALRGFSAKGNNAPVLDPGIGGANGFKRARHPGSQWTADLVMELTNIGDLNIYEVVENATILNGRIVKRQTGEASTNVFENWWHAEIMEANVEAVDNLAVVTMSIEGRYPKNGSDKGGLKPADSFGFKFVTQVPSV